MLSLLLAAVLALPAQSAVAQVPAAQDAPAAATPDAAAMQKEFDALREEYSKAEEAFWASMPRDASGEINVTEADMAKRPELSWGPRFLELGRRAGKTEAGCQALSMAMRMVDKPEATDEILELLTENFLDSPSLRPSLSQVASMRWSRGTRLAAATLRGVRDHTKNPVVKACATYELAQVLLDPVFEPGPNGMPTVTPGGAPDKVQARALLEELCEQHKDSEYAKRAAGSLFELDHLQLGMVAPDFEAKDQDGVAFKLSDYRGKVVLLDFWGFW